MGTAQPRFVIYEGNVRNLAFQLRRKGVKGVFDVSTASSIVLEASQPDGTDITPIVCTDGGFADWSVGLVIAPIDGTNVTGIIGTWTFSLTITIASEILTSTTGVIEVLDRPGFTLPP